MTRTVVQVSDSVSFGGAERVVLQLLDGFNRGRWRCVLLHPQLPPTAPLLQAAEALGIAHRASEFPVGRMGLRRLPHLVAQLRELSPAVLHAHLPSPSACRFTLLAAAIAGVPAVVTTVHLLVDVSSYVVKLRDRLLALGVDRYIAVSGDTASALASSLAISPRKIRVVPNGVSLAEYSSGNGSLRRELAGGTDAKLVLMVARLAQYKGHAYLFEAAARIPNVVLVLAGEGPERNALSERARALGIQDRVRFLGYRTDVPALLASCDLVTLPSLFEGLPLAVLEAMAAGKPVVATAIGGTDEAVVHGVTGLLVPPADADALAGAIRTIVSDDTFAHALGAAGRVRVEAQFRVERMVQQVSDIYDELLA